jgi:micrococcal nuclease
VKLTPKRVVVGVAGIVGVLFVGSVAAGQDDTPETPVAVSEPSTPTTTKAAPVPAPKATPEPGKKAPGPVVSSVVDGDTFKIGNTTYRMIGVDTPERGKCGFDEATELTTQAIDGKTVRLETDPTQGKVDRYGRSLVYVHVDDFNLGQRLIVTGHATEYTYSKPYRYQTLYKNAQKAAEAKGLGIWGTCTKKAQETPAEPAPGGVYYANCAAARDAGVTPLRKGDPGYRSGLDRDGDGVACE